VETTGAGRAVAGEDLEAQAVGVASHAASLRRYGESNCALSEERG
jgi:hypothetical protein